MKNDTQKGKKSFVEPPRDTGSRVTPILPINLSKIEDIMIIEFYQLHHSFPFFLYIQIQRAYKKYMKTIAGLLGGGSDAKQKMMRIYNFERDIANVSYVSDILIN